MTKENHNIDADDRTVFEVLNGRKYTVDYFQREYSWERKHVEQLVVDLTSAFLDAYTPGDARADVEGYATYYLGPFVVSSKDGTLSIIDGQQRLTSLTLLLVYLNNIQKEQGGGESIEPLIRSVKFGEESFNIQVEERKRCLKALFEHGRYDVRGDDDESTENMARRYDDIAEVFPDEIKDAAFPYFLDWLKENVVLVEIIAFSDDNAYAIFESMNDRGLNLTSTEMLKGFVLSRFRAPEERERANAFWKRSVQRLHEHGKTEDHQFFQAWLRSQYADTIRASRAGSSNEDFEKIGVRFHSWFRDNLSNVGLPTDSGGASAAFREFLHTEMVYYLGAYLQILEAQQAEREGWEPVFYIKHWGIAPSLAMPLMLAPLRPTDSAELTRQKVVEVARYIEAFSVRRAVNFRKFSSSSIRYTMYSLVKEIRGLGLDELRVALRAKLDDMDEGWDGVAQFRLHGQNRRFVKFLLSRITAFVESEAGAPATFSDYYLGGGKRPFEVEHVWADKFERHRDEFEQQHEFDAFRNRIGDLLLLPQGTNQSYGAKPYAEKREHYLKENLLAKSLHPDAYWSNPNFTRMAERPGLPFRLHDALQKADVDERQALVQAICERIWETGGEL